METGDRDHIDFNSSSALLEPSDKRRNKPNKQTKQTTHEQTNNKTNLSCPNVESNWNLAEWYFCYNGLPPVSPVPNDGVSYSA